MEFADMRYPALVGPRDLAVDDHREPKPAEHRIVFDLVQPSLSGRWLGTGGHERQIESGPQVEVQLGEPKNVYTAE